VQDALGGQAVAGAPGLGAQVLEQVVPQAIGSVHAGSSG
jgi:hypothetical protein